MDIYNLIKEERNKCIKYETNTKEFEYHWAIMNYLCELVRLRESYTDLFLKENNLK